MACRYCGHQPPHQTDACLRKLDTEWFDQLVPGHPRYGTGKLDVNPVAFGPVFTDAYGDQWPGGPRGITCERDIDLFKAGQMNASRRMHAQRESGPVHPGVLDELKALRRAIHYLTGPSA